MSNSRREFLHAGLSASRLISAGLLANGSLSGLHRIAVGAPTDAASSTRVISFNRSRYHGWPTLARRRDGTLLLVCSGGRERHVCPFGRVELMRSYDGGETWTLPQIIVDMPIDDRDAGILETKSGTLLATTFTSLAYEATWTRAEAAGEWPEERQRRWRAAHERLTKEQRQATLGAWMLRSTDDGITWSRPYNSLVNSPHGPIQLSSGLLFYAGKEIYGELSRIGVAVSTDDGASWSMRSFISPRTGDDVRDYHELHAVETTSGRIIVQIRNHNERNKGETLQCESSDGGNTWSDIHSIGVWGLPSHLMRLSDGRLLMTYGHRRQPFGNQARLSDDEGMTWSDPLIVSGDGIGGDLGYPSTIERDDRQLVTVWYEKMANSDYAVLRQRIWQVDGET